MKGPNKNTIGINANTKKKVKFNVEKFLNSMVDKHPNNLELHKFCSIYKGANTFKSKINVNVEDFENSQLGSHVYTDPLINLHDDEITNDDDDEEDGAFTKSKCFTSDSRQQILHHFLQTNNALLNNLKVVQSSLTQVFCEPNKFDGSIDKMSAAPDNNATVQDYKIEDDHDDCDTLQHLSSDESQSVCINLVENTPSTKNNKRRFLSSINPKLIIESLSDQLTFVNPKVKLVVNVNKNKIKN